MSHFVCLAVMPREDVVQNPLFGVGDDDMGELKLQYQEQYIVKNLDELMEPYYEGLQVEKEEYLNSSASDFLKMYLQVKKLKDSGKPYRTEMGDLMSHLNSQYEKLERWYEGDSLKVKNRELTKIMDKVQEFKFSLNNSYHMRWTWQVFGDNDDEMDWSWDINGNCWERYWTNPNAMYDWYVVGGRWRDMGNSGLIELSELFDKKEIPFVQTLPYFKLNAPFTDNYEEFIEKNVVENSIVKTFVEDDNGETVKDDNGKALVDEYYTKEELLKPVQVDKNPIFSFLFEDEGWVQAGEMGMFGISSLDMLSDEEREQQEQDQESLVSNIIKKYEDTHIGVVVDCHI